ncbi:hypothetical protein [Streptomyces capitiformicae]|jgi:hypothetical protein|uniref:Lipoprotein n=1 Tax=Streptomyces capitiformicae TaxID=2014920 RepID=A0A918Z0N9_9ACTN|nr:hypothetical protein [Streptomyces capitiformicae]GHE32759.1 hypothetical protein GCM10017771_49580 [Streptomyces capitiformicae]
MNRIIGTGIASALLIGGTVASAAPASAAAQGCADVGMKGYKISNVSTLYKGTNIYSDWVDDTIKHSISYTKTKTGTVHASGTVGVEAEVGAIFAKAKTSASITVGKQWSKTQSWNYTFWPKNKAGKTKVRAILTHESKKFKVRKWVIVASSGGACKTSWKWTKWITAPVKKDSNVWRLQYK